MLIIERKVDSIHNSNLMIPEHLLTASLQKKKALEIKPGSLIP